MTRGKDQSLLHDIRKELDGKIEGKVSYTVFCPVLGFIATLLSYFAYQNNRNQDKIETIVQRITVIETTVSERAK